MPPLLRLFARFCYGIVVTQLRFHASEKKSYFASVSKKRSNAIFKYDFRYDEFQNPQVWSSPKAFDVVAARRHVGAFCSGGALSRSRCTKARPRWCAAPRGMPPPAATPAASTARHSLVNHRLTCSAVVLTCQPTKACRRELAPLVLSPSLETVDLSF